MRASAASTISASRRRWAENVEAFWAIDCSSPMSVQTRVKRPTVASAAGTCMPQAVIVTARPTSLSATVLPPMFGPETISIRTSSSSRTDCGTARSSSSGWRPSRSTTTASSTSVGATASMRSAMRARAAARSRSR